MKFRLLYGMLALVEQGKVLGWVLLSTNGKWVTHRNNQSSQTKYICRQKAKEDLVKEVLVDRGIEDGLFDSESYVDLNKEVQNVLAI